MVEWTIDFFYDASIFAFLHCVNKKKSAIHFQHTKYMAAHRRERVSVSTWLNVEFIRDLTFHKRKKKAKRNWKLSWISIKRAKKWFSFPIFVSRKSTIVEEYWKKDDVKNKKVLIAFWRHSTKYQRRRQSFSSPCSFSFIGLPNKSSVAVQRKRLKDFLR